jgi:hypothetical protein
MKQQTALEAIRNNCRNCAGGSCKEVALCPCTDCPLYVYRFGIRPGGHEYRRRINLACKKWPKESREVGLK